LNKFKYRRPTVVAMLVLTALLTVYDVWAVTKGYDWTISATLLEFSRDWPIVPFVVGLLCGHVWFPNRAAGAGCEKRGEG
jgi:hypothetical protein